MGAATERSSAKSQADVAGAVTKQPHQQQLTELLAMVHPVKSGWAPGLSSTGFSPGLHPQEGITGVMCGLFRTIFGDCLVKEKMLEDEECWLGGECPYPPDGGATVGGHTPAKKVRFRTIPQIRLIETRSERFPPTLDGLSMKREAFLTAWEMEENRIWWRDHFHAHKGEATLFSCCCAGCTAEGEDTPFGSFGAAGRSGGIRSAQMKQRVVVIRSTRREAEYVAAWSAL